jgi:ketosteroid isomerase-like protein
MPRAPQPPVAATVSFIDCINRGDLAGLEALMTEDHRLLVLDEPPLIGRAANVEAWHGYFTAFPNYVIYPSHITARDNTVALLGVTTGSHLGLLDAEEMKLTVIWVAECVDGRVSSWRIVEDTEANRAPLGL